MRNRDVPTIKDHDRAYVESLLAEDDGEVLIFNKPSGLPVQTRGNRGRNLDHLLWAFARSNGKRPKLVHRLDTGTSGLVMAAKTHPVAVHFSRQFQERTVRKVYLAIVRDPDEAENEGLIDAPLSTMPGRPPRACVDEAGKPAQTAWRILTRGRGLAFVEVEPKTGRMHQIRAHMAHMGRPLLGDPHYGGDDAPRLMLHALSAEIEALSGEIKTYRVEPGEDWNMVLSEIGLS